MSTRHRTVATRALLLVGMLLSVPASAQTQLDPAAVEAAFGMRPLIGMMRDTLASTARQMAAADQPMDIDKMLDATDGGTSRRPGRTKPPPVDPSIRTLDCDALAARVTKIDAAIEARFVEVEAGEKVVDAQIKASQAAAGSTMATTSQMCNNGGLVGCLAAAAISRLASPAMDATAARNVAAVNDLDKLRSGFDPLLKERTTAIYYSERKACS